MPVSTSVPRLKRRRTKIVATLGPASRERSAVRALVEAGVEVFRLNFSHGTHEEHAHLYRTVREVAETLGQPVAVLADLCGPKIRTGRFRGGSVELETGSRVVVTVREVEGGPGLIPSRYSDPAGDVEPDDRILLDDGNLELRVEEVEGTEIECRVLAGGTLRDRKGINLPGVEISAPSLTPKDRADAAFALGLGVDFLALSFVRRARDMEELRELAAGEGHAAALVAKIEKPEALREIETILDAGDGIMVARGDLGVELPPEQVPIVQSQLVALARRRGKPVIVATQMLESMVENARPTRAEVTDVSNAVKSGADAVMLSAETAAGGHPVRAVEIMDRVARVSEGHLWDLGGFGTLDRPGAPEGSETVKEARPLEVQQSMARATSQLSRDLMVRAIVVFTRSGWSAGMMAAARPQAPILAVSPEEGTYRRLSLLWGVVPVLLAREPEGGDELHEVARRLARDADLAGEDDHILRVWGFHNEPARNMPTLSVLTV